MNAQTEITLPPFSLRNAFRDSRASDHQDAIRKAMCKSMGLFDTGVEEAALPPPTQRALTAQELRDAIKPLIGTMSYAKMAEMFGVAASTISNHATALAEGRDQVRLGMKPQPLPEETAVRIRTMAAAGFFAGEIGEAVGLSANAVYGRMAELGVRTNRKARKAVQQ